MRKTLRIMAVLAAFGLTAWIGVVALAQGSPAPAPGTTAITTTSPTVDQGDRFKGPCDEAEHANDPECVGANLVPEDNGADDEIGDDNGVDLNDDQGDDNDEQGEVEAGDDHSGPSLTSGHGSDDSGHGSDDSGHGSDDSGHGSDDSGHGGDD